MSATRPAREAEAHALAIGEATHVVGADGGRDLRLRLLQIAAETTASLRGFGDLAEGDLPTIAVERVEPKRDRVGQITAGQIVESGAVGEGGKVRRDPA